MDWVESVLGTGSIFTCSKDCVWILKREGEINQCNNQRFSTALRSMERHYVTQDCTIEKYKYKIEGYVT